jgi:hypothetical protein
MVKRIEQRNQIILHATPSEVFPLFDPVNERKWVKGWSPTIVFPLDGTVREQMIFTTPARFPEEEDYHWVMTRLVPQDWLVEYLVSTRERIWRIRVACSAEGIYATRAEICYQFTGLTPRGVERNEEALQKMFLRNLEDWAEAINFYLLTGKVKHD